MASRLKNIARGLAQRALRTPRVRHIAERAASSLDAALTPATTTDDFYGRGYFEKVGSRGEGKVSGYQGSYSRASSHADVLATVLLSHFAPRRSLEVGCARGYLIEALREAGVDAHGCDYSVYAVNTAARRRPRLCRTR